MMSLCASRSHYLSLSRLAEFSVPKRFSGRGHIDKLEYLEQEDAEIDASATFMYNSCHFSSRL